MVFSLQDLPGGHPDRLRGDYRVHDVLPRLPREEGQEVELQRAVQL